jgi:predicted RNA-binding Zn-ribbon protein involved in translation (DUF1610 family)
MKGWLIMSAEIECRKCGIDLEIWNNNRNLHIYYCPYCGKRLLKKQSQKLRYKTTVAEISGMIQDRLLDALDMGDGDIDAGDLAALAWEHEGNNGVVFFSNYEADLFVMRHLDWVDGALAHIGERTGIGSMYSALKAESNDKFLVPAFAYATENYLYRQIGVDLSEGILTKKRAKEIARLVKDTEYDGEWQ